ncbi:MAG: sigma-54-dependent Fis family transcriptional regulator [Candidatus Omnitrophica bacterium]|nr:sigma-54-dependent Fis family transcriptional regulator [Candidatus Omnitrophota bacterium]
MNSKINLLIVDDEETLRLHLKKEFLRKDYEVHEAGEGQAALNILKEHHIDVVLLDLVMPGLSGLDALKEIKANYPLVEVIVLTGNATIDTAIASMKLGAYDYLMKPYNIAELSMIIERAHNHALLSRDSQRLQHELARQAKFEDFIHGDEKMKSVFKLIEKVAPTNSTVLLYGETGTGKELAAKSIHKNSNRKENSFIAVDCGALQDTLLESELFGHERGAFTGAIRDKQGLIEVADSGTLFLDEIGDISPAMQVKLLRFLESGEYRMVGSTRVLKIDVRIIAATNRNLERIVKEGRFREDLYYRLNVVKIEIPPLRERKDDIMPLAEHFLKKYNSSLGRHIKGISKDAEEKLLSYAWPGNVRELENAIERVSILCDGDWITIEDLPFLTPKGTLNIEKGSLDSMPLSELEKMHIINVLKSCDGNKTRAAGILGIEVRTLYNKLKTYDVT